MDSKYQVVIFSFLFFGICLFLGCQDQKQITSQAIFVEYYAPYKEYTSFKSRDSLLENQLNEALQNYLNHNYQKAFEQFSGILAQNNENQITATFYTALSLIEMPNSTPDQNILIENLFADLHQRGHNPFQEDALWYRSLHQLKVGKKREAIIGFEKLKTMSGKYFEQVNDILEKIPRR